MKTVVAIGAHYDDVELRAGGTLAKFVQSQCRVIYVVATTTPYYYPSDEDCEIGRRKSNSDIIALRKSEATNAAQTLGISEIHFWDFKSLYWYKDGTNDLFYFDGCNTSFESLEDLKYLNEKIPGREFIVSASNCHPAIDFLCDFLKSNDVDVVLTHFPDDQHWEHYATSAFVYRAVQQLFYDGIKLDMYAWEYGGADSMLSTFAPTLYVDISDTIDLKCKSLTSFPSQFKDHNTDFFLERARKRAEQYGKLVGMKYAEPFMKFSFQYGAEYEVCLPESYDISKAKAIRSTDFADFAD